MPLKMALTLVVSKIWRHTNFVWKFNIATYIHFLASLYRIKFCSPNIILGIDYLL